MWVDTIQTIVLPNGFDPFSTVGKTVILATRRQEHFEAVMSTLLPLAVDYCSWATKPQQLIL